MSPRRRPGSPTHRITTAPTTKTAPTAPTHVPMAPMAGPGPALATATRRQRRAWWQAAAATGVLLAPAHAAVASGFSDELPADLLGAVVETDGGDLPFGPWDGVTDAWTTPLAVGATGTGPWARGAGPPAASATEVADDGSGALPDGTNEVARYGDVVLVTEGSSVELVGFHEAADPAALELAPTGDAVAAHLDEDLGPVVTLPTRDRATAPTSSVDLAVRAGEPVVAPVTGEVVQVTEFALYGSTRDVLIEIRADDDPDILVKVLHVEDPSVAVGDRVEAGDSEIAATARQLPFESQIDAYTALHRGAPAPHVHIELRYDVI